MLPELFFLGREMRKARMGLPCALGYLKRSGKTYSAAASGAGAGVSSMISPFTTRFTFTVAVTCG